MSNLRIPLSTWKPIGTVQTSVLVLDITTDPKEFHALDLKSGLVFLIKANTAIALPKIEKEKEYDIIFKAFKNTIASTPKEKWVKRAETEINLATPKPKARYKFELAYIHPIN